MDAKTNLFDRINILTSSLEANAARNDRVGRIPREQLDDIASSGILALTVPRVAGGAGANVEQTVDVLRRLGRADPSAALILSMHFIQHLIIDRTPGWPKYLAGKLTDDALAGKGWINALRVEPELGSPSRGGLPQTIARRDKDGWRLTGHKIYSTGSTVLDWYLVWARTDEDDVRVGAFLVQAGLPGTKIVETWDHLGLRASGSHDIIFEDVRIPHDHAIDLRRPEDWRRPELVAGSLYPLLIGVIYDGIAQAARNWLVQFLKTRSPSSLGVPLSTLSRVQEAVGDIEIKLATNDRLIRSFAQEFDARRTADPLAAGSVKLAVTSNAIATVEQALLLTGNHGLSRRNPLERHHRDVLCGRIHAPQDDSTRVALGLSALN
ncbi:acyl-CoA dehydrogenase family protein [Afipia sp. DC4300-2b1]|uniref:acyl-CoA dehydrogenase family protein n=1 Tax=Afipia sp. DC4300-2b1 TaxID=2804672 RepID=UPI003CF71CAC